MKVAVVVLLELLSAAACSSDPKPGVIPVPMPALVPERTIVASTVSLDELLAPSIERTCVTSSECAGFGRCSNGTCGHCVTSSECNGNGRCDGGKCGACVTTSECKIGTCRNNRCG